MKRIGKRGSIGLAAAVAMLALGAGAYGYFTSAGSGSGSASVDDAEPVSLEAETPTSSLYPGTSADVAVKITNPNAFRVFIPSLLLDESEGDDGFDVDGGHSGCNPSALSYTPQDNSGAGWFVPGTDSPSNERSLDLADAISMHITAANECQGATFTVYLAVGT